MKEGKRFAEVSPKSPEEELERESLREEEPEEERRQREEEVEERD